MGAECLVLRVPANDLLADAYTAMAGRSLQLYEYPDGMFRLFCEKCGELIPAYNLVNLDRGLFYSGSCKIGAALNPMGARPRLSPRPNRPRRSGPI